MKFVDAETNTELCARMALSAPLEATGRFMFMPAGQHVVHLSKGGTPLTVAVDVDPKEAAAALNAQLASVCANRAPQKPYCDFNHDRDKASFWPTKFVAEADGVYVEGEWSGSGKTAVESKDYRGFSPTFYTDAEIPDKPLRGKDRLEIPDGKLGSPKQPARIVCNPNAGLNFGGLVNEPAFTEIKPLFAKQAETAATSGDGQQQQTNDDMKKTIAELQAAKNNLEAQVNALNAKASRTEIENAQLEARRAELHSAEQDVKIAELEAAEVTRKTADADAAVKRAVERLAIPAQDTALQAKWKTNCANNPEMIVVLDAIPGTGSALTAKQTPNGTQVQVQAMRMGPAEAAKKLIELQGKNAQCVTPGEKLKHAKEVHLFYAKEIRDNKEFLEMPLDAATPADNIGTLAGTLVAQRTLELYKYEFPVLSQITSDYSDQPAQYNQTTTTRIVTVPAVMTYDATIDAATGRAKGWVIATQAITTDVSVTIDNHKAVELNFDANTLGSTARRLFDEQSEGAQYALGKAMVDSLYAKIVVGSYTTNAAFAEAAVDFGRRTFSKCKRILTVQGAPQANRFALINSPYMEKLEQDPTLVALATYQKPEIITDSQLPRISRFLPLEAPNLPTTSNMAAFFAHRSALLIQTRVPNDYTTVLGPSSGYGNVMVVTNPDTGMSVMLVQYVSHQGGYAGWRIAAMWGSAVGNEKGGQIVKSA